MKTKLFAIILVIVFLGCNNNSRISHANAILYDGSKYLSKSTTLDSLLSHFPKEIKNDKIHFCSFLPDCPPEFKCTAQFGHIYIIVKKTDYQEELTELLSGGVAYKTDYKDSNNIIVDVPDLKNNYFPVAKCNKWYPNKLAIPYFEGFDFNLGYKEEQKDIKGETYVNYVHTIPEDLQVYVLEAEAGSFWVEDCNEARPKSLKEWKNGYSKGVAVSDKENIIMYWLIIW